MLYFYLHTQKNSMNLLLKPILVLLLFTSIAFYSKAQNYVVKGTVLDTAGLPLPGAVVRISWTTDSLAMSASADGAFNFNKVKSRQFTLSAAFIGFQAFVKEYSFAEGTTFTAPDIKLKLIANTLDQVTISGVPPVRVTEDTVSFNAASFPVREGDAVDEMLKKLPGIKVDKDGNVTNQGTPVTKIKVNGKDFFGTDVATAIKNLPAEIIKNLQFIDDYGDQAKLTGIKTGEPEKVLNLTIQEDKKKGYFARASGGVGNSDRYNTSLRANSMKAERMVSFDGTVNNANMRGGGGDGITTRNAAGLNYKNEWNPRISADGGYNFNNTKNNTVSSAYTQNFLQDFTRFEDSRNDNQSTRFGHDFWGNVEYKPDSMNYLKISPNFSYNTNEGIYGGISNIVQQNLITNRTSSNFNNDNNLNARTGVFFNHKLAKKGRNINFWGNINYSSGENLRDVSNDYVITEAGIDSLRSQNQLTDQNNNNFSTNAGGSYMEPIWKKTFLEVNYNWSRSATTNNKDTRDVISGTEVFNPDLSNNFNYQFITNKVGMNYRFIDEKYNYTLGINAQPTVLKGQNVSKGISTEQKNFNVIPSARFVYKFSKQEQFDVNYWGRNNQPNFFQLQPISDNSNLQNVVTGNPDLKPEFIHSVNAQYKKTDWDKGQVLTLEASYNQTENKIVTTKELIPNTVNQITSYTNTGGFYNANGKYNITRPFFERKFTFEYSGEGWLNNNVTFINNERNTANNAVWRQEVELRLDLEDVVNLEIETSYSQNKTKYSQAGLDDRLTNRFEYGINGRNYFFEDLTLGYDFTKVVNTGFDNSFVNNPTILRLFMEYKFLKHDMGTLRLDGFDLFDQNSGISRDVFDNVIVDRRVNRLGRYFMMSFIFRVRKFGG